MQMDSTLDPYERLDVYKAQRSTRSSALAEDGRQIGHLISKEIVHAVSSTNVCAHLDLY